MNNLYPDLEEYVRQENLLNISNPNYIFTVANADHIFDEIRNDIIRDLAAIASQTKNPQSKTLILEAASLPTELGNRFQSYFIENFKARFTQALLYHIIERIDLEKAKIGFSSTENKPGEGQKTKFPILESLASTSNFEIGKLLLNFREVFIELYIGNFKFVDNNLINYWKKFLDELTLYISESEYREYYLNSLVQMIDGEVTTYQNMKKGPERLSLTPRINKLISLKNLIINNKKPLIVNQQLTIFAIYSAIFWGEGDSEYQILSEMISNSNTYPEQ